MSNEAPVRIIRTHSDEPDFGKLIAELDKHLSNVFGVQQEFYDRLNVINRSNTVVLAYKDEIPAGCGCLREYDSQTVEVKRMFVPAEYRGMGIASRVLHELEEWAKELGYKQIILETGTLLKEARALYQKHGYQVTEKWGEYVDAENSVCMKKVVA